MDELVKEVRRLFSTKNNPGRQVRKRTNQLHHLKIVILFVCIVVLVGYSQFRPHFHCQGRENTDTKMLTNFCWTNGTYTIGLKNQDNTQRPKTTDDRQWVPHVGIRFKQTSDGRYRMINHNYMHSLWLLQILMLVCSYWAQRRWASVFENDVLKALLQLPGYKDLPVTKKAQELKPYATIVEQWKKINENQTQKNTEAGNKQNHLSLLMETIVGDDNEHNHLLDYYPNQLIYLLLNRRASSYKLSGLRLRLQLIMYAVESFVCTLMQYLLPLFFIGSDYSDYGWVYFKSLLIHQLRSIKDPNYTYSSADYELSARIWPTVTSCIYKEFGFTNMDRLVVQCSVPINEICAKAFAYLWLLWMLNFMVETHSLGSTLVYSFNFATVKWNFNRKFSIRTQKEAKVIATFRYRHAMALQKLARRRALGVSVEPAEPKAALPAPEEGSKREERPGERQDQDQCELSENKRKLLEAEREQSDRENSLRGKKWYLWCSLDIRDFFKAKSKKIAAGKLLAKTNKTPSDALGYKELREDMNIYYLLELIHLRLGSSKKKTEQVIHMASEALSKYLEIIHLDEKGTLGEAVGEDTSV